MGRASQDIPDRECPPDKLRNWNGFRGTHLFKSNAITISAKIYFFKKLFRIISNGTIASLVSVENLENEEKSKGFASAGINVKFNGVNVTTVVHGVTGDWQLFISREKQ